MQVAVDSPVFTPQQYYLIGFVQDSWRATDRLTLDLGLRYDFYSVVREKDGLARPFFIEDNAFSSDPDNFYNPDKNNFAPRLSAAYALNSKTAVRAGFGLFYGPGQFEDRIQPIDIVTRARQVPAVGQVDYKTSGCVDGLVINGNPIRGCGYASYNALQISGTRRFQRGFTGGFQYQYSRNKGTTQGSNEAATTQNTFDYETEYGTNPQDIPHTVNGSLVYLIPGDGLWKGGWRVGGIVNARSGVPINVSIARPDNVTIGGATVTNIPGGNSRGTQRPDQVPGVNPYLKDGVRWLNPAAFTTPQPGTFGDLPRNARGPGFWQADLMFSKDFRFLDSRGCRFAWRCSTSPTA